MQAAKRERQFTEGRLSLYKKGLKRQQQECNREWKQSKWIKEKSWHEELQMRQEGGKGIKKRTNLDHRHEPWPRHDSACIQRKRKATEEQPTKTWNRNDPWALLESTQKREWWKRNQSSTNHEVVKPQNAPGEDDDDVPEEDVDEALALFSNCKPTIAPVRHTITTTAPALIIRVRLAWKPSRIIWTTMKTRETINNNTITTIKAMKIGKVKRIVINKAKTSTPKVPSK